MQQQAVTVVAGARADRDVFDREVAAVHQFVAVVSRHELIQAHARPVHAKPDEVSRPHASRVWDRLEVRQVASQLERLEPGGKRVVEQVAGHQVSERHAVQPVAESVLTTAHPGRVLGPDVPECGIKVTREHLIHCPPPPLAGGGTR